MKNELKNYCSSLHIEDVGIAAIGPYNELAERWRQRLNKGHVTGFEEKDFERRIDPQLTLDNAQSVIVCLFPYFSGRNGDSNLSKSSITIDYHLVVQNKLELIGKFLKNKITGFEYKAFVDNGPLADRYLAYLSGLGYFGINSHIFADKYGSYVYIGYIINNHPFEPDKPLDKTCKQCGNCIRNCPGNAILGNFDINPLLCRSFITQKKGELLEDEINIIKKSPLIFGCDICQDVCPHNKAVPNTPIREFTENIVHKINNKEIKEISNKEFKRRYGNRSFSWRGKGILQRNFELINRDKNHT
ncbi:MAG: tRNA epoxyqueuosine(34) reductase QueG [Clostridiales bacterium GWB2_37_7]|nr:MAG: tRNA epoxyqueuosine(34) reductase QueG [Clostridiales bacterium GWB2_37_7]